MRKVDSFAPLCHELRLIYHEIRVPVSQVVVAITAVRRSLSSTRTLAEQKWGNNIITRVPPRIYYAKRPAGHDTIASHAGE